MRLFNIGIGKLAGAARFLAPVVGGLFLHRSVLPTRAGPRAGRQAPTSTFAIIKIEVNLGGK